jgi:hypothetical protein
MATRKKSEKFTTPAGEAAWPFLSKPSFHFSELGDYKVDLILSEEEASELIEMLKEKTDELYKSRIEEMKKSADGKTKAKAKNLSKYFPFGPEFDDDGEETGRVVIKFKRKASYKDKKTSEVKTITIPIFDAKGVLIKSELKMGNGSIVKVCYLMSDFYNPKDNQVGYSLKIMAVQLLKLVEFGASASAYGFGEEDEGFDAEAGGFAGEDHSTEDEDATGDF